MGRSRIPIARTRALNTTPNARSLSRKRYLGALSHGNASVIWRASHSAVGLRVTQTTTAVASCDREQEMRTVAETRESKHQHAVDISTKLERAAQCYVRGDERNHDRFQAKDHSMR